LVLRGVRTCAYSALVGVSRGLSIATPTLIKTQAKYNHTVRACMDLIGKDENGGLMKLAKKTTKQRAQELKEEINDWFNKFKAPDSLLAHLALIKQEVFDMSSFSSKISNKIDKEVGKLVPSLVARVTGKLSQAFCGKALPKELNKKQIKLLVREACR